MTRLRASENTTKEMQLSPYLQVQGETTPRILRQCFFDFWNKLRQSTQDMQAQLGSPNFWRLRLGIGHPGDKAEVASYVLRKPPAAEREAIHDCINKSIADALDLLIAGDMERALMKIHAKPPRPKPPRPEPPPTPVMP